LRKCDRGLVEARARRVDQQRAEGVRAEQRARIHLLLLARRRELRRSMRAGSAAAAADADDGCVGAQHLRAGIVTLSRSITTAERHCYP
jgi:hypothetical protein